jgi:hypothetical protein
MISTYSDSEMTAPASSVTPGGVLYLDITVVDSAGNPVAVTGSQLAIALSAPEASLSATEVYISVGHSDTASSFGPIAYVAPMEHGAQNIYAAGAVYSSSGYVVLGTFSVKVIVHP